jgi:hypothetical protein
MKAIGKLKFMILFIFVWYPVMLLHAQNIKFSENATDESAGNVPCFKIETDLATYYLEKYGLGLSSMVDKEGNDWISFHKAIASRAGGEFRGFPNAVHQQPDGSFFHPKNSGTGFSFAEVTYNGPDKVTIRGISGSNNWQCQWDFFSTHCSFTMTRMLKGAKYWILYEGTPGGKFENTGWWMTSRIKEKIPITKTHEGDIPEPEWIVFGDKDIKRVIFLLNHSDDRHPDRFYPMDNLMTVFGFGRDQKGKHITRVPQKFSIGFVESTDHQEISQQIKQLLTDN